MALGDGPVQVADVIHAHGALQLEVLLVGVEHLLLRHEGVEPSGVFALGQLQEDAVSVGDEVEERDAAGGGREAAVEVVDVTVEAVVGGVGHAGGLDEQGTVVHPLLTEGGQGVLGADDVADEGAILADDLLHALLDAADVVLGHRFAVLEGAVETFRNGVLEAEGARRIEVVDGLDEDEAEGAQVDAIARGVGVVDELDVLRVPAAIGEALYALVDPCAEGRVT